jgi:hypothetical protein
MQLHPHPTHGAAVRPPAIIPPRDQLELERLRRKLSRSYDLVSSARLLTLGHAPDDLGRLARAWRLFRADLEYQFLPHYFSSPPRWRLFLRGFHGRRTLPDFCVIGPVKSGSSDLAVSLLLHPAVMAPLAKEIRLPDPRAWAIYYPTEREKRRHARVHGAALSPFLGPYLHWMELTERLWQCRPDTKIVLTLRDPVQRVLSHWKWDCFLSGKQAASSLPFLRSFSAYVDRALEVFPDYPMYTACGFQALHTSIYWQAVKLWMDRFGRERILAIEMDAYFRDRSAVLRRIQDFVGLPRCDLPADGLRVNVNPLALPPPDQASLSRLRRFFAPYNARLWTVLGERWDW